MFKGRDMFSQGARENLGYYVYVLVDPRDRKCFYVGKGLNDRVFDHLACTADKAVDSDKIDKINDIRASKKEVEVFILRHGMTEDCAFEVEAALIDFIGIDILTNLQKGHNSNFGIKDIEEIEAMYNPKELVVDRPVLLININRLFRRNMTPEELYEATRCCWGISIKRVKENDINHAVAVYRGLTREVYEIDRWEKKEKGRCGFFGKIATDSSLDDLRYKSVRRFYPRGAARPHRYVTVNDNLPDI